MLVLLQLALAAPTWQPVWSTRLGGTATPHLELLGTDEGGTTAWIRVGDGPRRTTALWQVDLTVGRRTGSWEDPDTPVDAFGAMAPLVDTPGDLTRLGLLQAHLAGRPTWPLLSLDPLGSWIAWEHGGEAGGDAVSVLHDATTRLLGIEGLAAVYRPRFHPEEPVVAYVGASARGEYHVYLEDLADGRNVPVHGLGHASQLDWDAHGQLWVTGESCVWRVPADSLQAEQVTCGSDLLHTRLSPDGRSLAVVDVHPEQEGVLLGARLQTSDGELVGNTAIRGGRSIQAYSDDGWLLVTALDGSKLVSLATPHARPVELPVAVLGGTHDHWPRGCTLGITWDPGERIVGVGWIVPPG